jgi:uncharacterized repeat protein (TIGR01451 family)
VVVFTLVSGLTALLPASASAAPANDNFANAQGLSGTSASASGTTAGATYETNEPPHFSGDGSVWYAWTPPVSGVVTLDACVSSGPVRIQLYQGTVITALQDAPQRYPFPTPQCSSSSSDLNLYHVTAGLPYRIAISEYVGDATFTLGLNEAGGPPNDSFANATDLGSPSSVRVAGTTASASVEPGEEGYDDDPGNNESVWYRFQEPTDVPMWIDSCGSTSPLSSPKVNLFRGSSLGSLTPVNTDLALTPEGQGNCQDLWGVHDSAEVNAFTAKAGATYYVQVLWDSTTEEEPFHLGLRQARFDGSVSQSSSRKAVSRGQTVTFHIQVKNRGDLPMSPAVDIVVSKPNHLGRVSPGTRYVSIKQSQGRCKRVKFFGLIPGAICEPGTIKAGASMTITARVRAGAAFQHLVEIDYLHQGEGNNDDDNPKNSDSVKIVKVRGGGHG